MQGCLAKSTEIMTAMNKLVSVKEIRETMMAMAREMEKSGLVDEIIGETMSSMEPEGLDSQADAEVDKIMAELTAGVLAPAASAPVNAIRPAQGKMTAQEQQEQQQQAAEEDLSTQEMLSRIHAL
mmetsp:Transcript_10185/g.15290  ORF Transcript_10185/g.15290 Transcript_10185/m.15290 type:complete len:125 (-) Transcript_10185:107-481(-)